MNRLVVTALPAVLALLGAGCGQKANPVADYLLDAEVRCETEAQRCNICTALQDIILLTPAQLRDKRYCNSAGTPGRWDLPTLVQRHFVPARAGAALGTKFYRDVKAPEVREWAERTLARLNELSPFPSEPGP